jgi:hypothetical protein
VGSRQQAGKNGGMVITDLQLEIADFSKDGETEKIMVRSKS